MAAGCAGVPANDAREPAPASAAQAVPSQQVKARFTYHPSGAFKAIGAFGPGGVPASTEKPAHLVGKIPADFTAPVYAVFRFGAGQEAGLVSNEPGGKLDRFVVDANGNADLTDDPVIAWGAEGDIRYMQVQMNLDGVKRPAGYGIYRTGAIAQRGGYFTTFPDYYMGGTVTLGAKTYDALLWDGRGAANFSAATPPPAANGDNAPIQGRRVGGPVLMIDIDGSHSYHPQLEQFRAFDPFNIGGVTYEFRSLKADGSDVELFKSDHEVAPRVAQPPPDPNLGNGLVAGKSALDFQATTLDGNAVHLLESYKGKIVMLDFWATWCGPCMREMPHVAAAYEKLHDRGFTVLGISLDRENAADKIREVAAKNDMPWQQVYDGKYFEAAIAKQYQIKSIPAAYLIDGNTGKILANGYDVRGDKLIPAIEKALGSAGSASQPAGAQPQAAVSPAAPEAAAAPKKTIGDTAPLLNVDEWFKGKPVSHFEKGHVYVVEFWATWCQPCILGMPHLSDLAKKYPDVTVIGVTASENRPADQAKAREFVKVAGDMMAYTVAYADPQGPVKREWLEATGQRGIPAAYVIDKQGKIAWQGHPLMGLDEAVELVRRDKLTPAAAAEISSAWRARRAEGDKIDAALKAALKENRLKDALELNDQVVAHMPFNVAIAAGKKYALLTALDPAVARAYGEELLVKHGNAPLVLKSVANTIFEGSDARVRGEVKVRITGEPDYDLAKKLLLKSLQTSAKDGKTAEFLARLERQ